MTGIIRKGRIGKAIKGASLYIKEKGRRMLSHNAQ